ncbi:MAG: HAD family hydrolase [Firmicutes bacterium]|nr:HAD family hydrolase [Bacillota bacterium]
MVRAVVFDLWNTLVHSRGGDPFRHLHAVLTQSQRARFQELKRDAMVQRHADAHALLARWRGPLNLTDEQSDTITGIFRRAVEDTECFPETCEALEATRHVARVALLSNTQSFDLGFLDRLGIVQAIAHRFLSAETGFLKPEENAFAFVQQKLGLFPGQLVMVGDSWNDDVKGALNAGWTALWLNRDGKPRPDDLDPDAELVEIQSLAQVAPAVERLQAGARCSTCLG